MIFGTSGAVAAKSRTSPSTSSKMGMTVRNRLIYALAVCVLAVSAPTGPAHADTGDRIALVVVAEDYPALGKSEVGGKRATDMAAALEAKGFTVILGANATSATARAKLAEFSRLSEDADVALAVLVGHGAATGGQSFFLPANTDIGRSTDLLSRAVSVPTVAQIAGKARIGGVFFFLTTPVFKAPVAGLDARPQFTGEPPANTVVVFSTGPSVPVSSIDQTSQQAADAFVAALARPDARMIDAVDAVAGTGKAQVAGKPADLALQKPAVAAAEPAPAPLPTAAADAAPAPAPTADPALLAAEQAARAQAEEVAASERAKADEARLAAERARADVELAKAEAAKAQAEAERAQAEALKAKAEAERAQAEAAQRKAEADLQIATATTSGASPLIPERELGRQERRRIQEKLRSLSLYTGPIDSVMGPLTREAIMGYQRSRQEAVTGFLTSDQYQALLAVPD